MRVQPWATWVGRPAFDLDVYAQLFDGARIELMGESPYLNAKGAGVSFALDGDDPAAVVRTVFLYSHGVENFAQYAADPLPAGLSFASSRADVRRSLGQPVQSGDASSGVGLIAIEFSFDRFESDELYLRFEYHPGDGAVRLVTIGLCGD
jgi:hypothetical protein